MEHSWPADGACFTGTNRRGDFEWSVPCVTTACKPPTLVEWTVGNPAVPSSTWSYEFKEDAEGATVVVQRFQHGPGFSFVRRSIERAPDDTNAIILARCTSLPSGMEATLAAAGLLLDEDEVTAV